MSGLLGLAMVLVAVFDDTTPKPVTTFSSPEAAGQIRVEDGSPLEEWDLEHCFPDQWCAHEVLLRQVVAQGGRATMENLQSVSAVWPDLIASCHTVSHELGIAAAEHRGPEAAFADGAPNCQFGYYHGILIGEAERLGDDVAFAKRAPELCQLLNTDFLSYSSCVHGIGHAAAVRTENLRRGADMCGQLSTEERQWCVSGVVMEWSTSVAAGLAREAQLSREELRDACLTLEAVDQDSCFREIPSAWTMAFKVPTSEMLNWCAESAPQATAAAMCALGVGFTLAGRTDGDPQVIEKECSLNVDDELAAYCAAGAAVIVFEMFESFDRARALSVCPALPEAWREICEVHLSQTVVAYEGVA